MTHEQRRPGACAATRKPSWPQGATAGLLVIAAACLGLTTALYQVAGPRDVFAEEVGGR